MLILNSDLEILAQGNFVFAAMNLADCDVEMIGCLGLKLIYTFY